MTKIAVIGSGIAGMTAAHLLSRKNEVHLFESGPELGGHTATKDVTVASGRYAVDTGFIVFNDWTYPNFIKLMTSLGVRWKDTEMSFSVKNAKNGLEYNGASFGHLFAQKRNLVRPSFYRMLLEIMRFNRESLELLERPDDLTTLSDYLRKNRYSAAFAENYILAMGAAVWSASLDQMRAFPAQFFVRFFKNHGMLSVNERPVWKVIEGGSRSYIAPLTACLGNRIHLSTPIEGVVRTGGENATSVCITTGGENPRSEIFDHVVFACHSDTVKRILKDASPLEHEVFDELDYQPNEVVLHTDTSVLPKIKKTWAAWNYFVPKREGDRVAVTYHMNILQRFESPENFLVSLNMGSEIDPSKVLGRWVYDHPKFTVGAVASQKRWAEISGLKTRTHFAGAYWSYGFHEDGVNSGLRVAATFGEKL